MASRSSEHRAIIQCYPDLCSCIQQSPTGVATQLRPLELLAPEDWAFMTNSQNNNDEKARRIVDVVLNQVELDSQMFHSFVSALEAAGPWTRTIICKLKQILGSLSPCCKEIACSASDVSEATKMGKDCSNIASCIQKFEKRFVDLRKAALEECTEKVVDVTKFRQTLMTLPGDITNEHEQFLMSKHCLFKTAETVEDIFLHLNFYLSFIDFSLLEHIIEYFGSDGLKQRMRQYSLDMSQFRKETTINEVIPYLPRKSHTPPGYSKLEIKADFDIETSTLEDLDLYRKQFASEFLLSQLTLCLMDVKKSSLLVTWLIPSAIVQPLKEGFEVTDESVFLRIHILKLTLDGYCWFPPKEEQADTTAIPSVLTAESPTQIDSEPLNSYPSANQLSKLQVQEWRTLGRHLGLTEDEVGSIDKHHNPTAAVLRAAKVKNIDLTWKGVVDGLLKAGEYTVAERVCSEQGDGQTWSLTWRGFVEGFFKVGQFAEAERVCSEQSAKNPDACVLNMACTKGYTKFAQYLIAKKKINDTLLHAVKCGHSPELEFLLSEYHADSNVTDKDNTPLLALATDHVIAVQLLKHGAQADNVYKTYSKHIGKLSSKLPPDNPLAIFITGDGGVGKSTFLKSMLSSKGFMARFSKAKPVSGVDEKTVGIIPYEIVTETFGRVICYDFAGQQEFYASHCAILQNAVRTSPPIIVYLADLTMSEQKMTNSTTRWMALVQNQCTIIEGRAHVIVVGSHADILKERKEDPWSKEKMLPPIFKKFPKLKFIAFIPMDCRYPDTNQMKEAKKLIQKSSAILRSPETVSLNAHAFYTYLLDSFKEVLAVSLGDVQEQIHRDLDQVKSKRTKNLLSFIPSILPRLLEICDQLSKKGLILYLHNEGTPERSFIICDRATLLSKVTGTVFAPESFRQHCALASSTGVVPLPKFSEAFHGYDIEMLIAFIAHLELCFEITDKAMLESIREQEQNPESIGRYLFFPGLIRIETPEQLWEEDPTLSCHFGWIIECSQDIEFFDPRCLQVLILRLVFTFGLAPARRVHHIFPSLQRSCSVWKNGIFWGNDDGVDSHIELCDNGKSIVLKMRSEILKPEFLSIRSQIISIVLETVGDFCPNITLVESVINPQQVKQHPLKPSPQLTLFSISDIASAVALNKEKVSGSCRSVALTKLLQFEPYASLDHNTLQCIHSETMRDENISDAFISYFVLQVSNPDCIRIYMTILSHDQLPGAQALIHTLETWRDKTEGTYSCLRETLNRYSIFAGRNPLELAGLAPCVVDPSVFTKPLDTDQLTKVVEATKEVCSDWNSLAVELDISHGVRKAIERDYPTDEARFHAILRHWARSVSPPNWSALVKALQSTVIGCGVIASKVETVLSYKLPRGDVTPPTLDIDPQGPLSVNKHLKMVRSVVWDMRASWRGLGVELGISVGTLETIEHNHHHIAGPCLTDVLENWLDRTIPQPKWTDIIFALRSSAVRRGDIAKHVETMLKGQEVPANRTV